MRQRVYKVAAEQSHHQSREFFSYYFEIPFKRKLFNAFHFHIATLLCDSPIIFLKDQ